MGKIELLRGNYAASYGVKLSKVQVIAAYPITPQTSIVEVLANCCESGELNAAFVRVESEHSAMSAAIGASAAGARVFTASGSQGLLYMAEVVHWAAGARLPIIMAIVNRALAAPWSVWTDHQDAISMRDSGWIQFFAKNNQEVLDTIIQVYKIAEDVNVCLPAMVNLDGFILSHTVMPVDIPEQEEVDDFLPPRPPGAPYELDSNNPMTYGNIADPTCYDEFRFSIHEAMQYSKKMIKKTTREFEQKFGRNHGALLEEYRCTNDAEILVFSMGTMAEEAEIAVDLLRDEGIRAGSAKVRVFRPFPAEDIIRLSNGLKALLVIDRNLSFGLGGALASEIKASLYQEKRKPFLRERVMGLGGRDVTAEIIAEEMEKTLGMVEKEEEVVIYE
ncbi:MAG: transketolase C-terminal domain-containing protein [Candidatus Hodarchaeota archaeon]